MTVADETVDKLPVVLFRNAREWERWLAKHHTEPEGLWLRIAKKNSGLDSVSYAEALDSALCWGWIDGLKRSYDEATWIQKFTPRRKRSMWSKVNQGKVEALIAEGRMQPAGLAEIERAKADGRWDAAYDSFSSAEPSEDFQAALDASPEAAAAFAALNRQNRYSFIVRVQMVRRADTRARKIAEFIAMLERGETIGPGRSANGQ